jgi:hypothetical protein
MMTRTLRRSLQRQEGQALVLACLLVLTLSIALITTVNIGHSVHERVRLQNTADAAAYSTAAMEARAFNFYAFANRTQVSHYVSAMMWQSLNSFLFFVQAFLTDIYGFMRTIGPCFPKDARKKWWKVICGILDYVPYINIIMKALDLVFKVLHGLLKIMKPVMEPIDKVLGKVVVPGHKLLNSIMAGASTLVMYAASSYVFGTSNRIIGENDPNVDALIPQTLSGLINQCLFNRAHYKESNGTALSPVNPLGVLDPEERKENSKVARAKRVMAGITNATRFPCDSDGGICPESFVTDRRLGSLLPIPDWLKPLEMFLNDIPKWGQTRFLTYKLGYGDNRATGGNKIREHNDLANSPMGMIAQGDVIGADDPYYIRLLPFSEIDLGIITLYNPFHCPRKPGGGDNRNWEKCWGDPREDDHEKGDYKKDTMKTSIWAMSKTDLAKKQGGIHWRVKFPGSGGTSSDREVGLYQYRMCVLDTPLKCLLKMDVYVANVRPIEDGNHPWSGLAPFPHFEPGQYKADCTGFGKKGEADIHQAAKRENDFNQPSSWVLLNKDTNALHNPNADDTGATRNGPALLNSNGQFSFKFGASPTTLVLDNNRKKLAVGGFTISSGMSVISRGQTYYHRPGNWTEQPNFFNPYWRPRLAAVWQGKESLPLVNDLADMLPADFKNAPAKIITH